MQHPRCVLCKLGGGRYAKTQLSLYLFFWADDMFRPLWAILRSQKCMYFKLKALCLCDITYNMYFNPYSANVEIMVSS